MIEIQEEDIVLVSDALMAGALGGLGQSISHWINKSRGEASENTPAIGTLRRSSVDPY